MRDTGKGGKKPIEEVNGVRPRKAKLERLRPDVTKHKKLEKLVERSKKEWENTFNAMSDWICVVDLESTILQSNRAGEKFTGVPVTEIVGQSTCRLVHGTEKHIVGCPLLKMLQTKQQESAEIQVPNTDKWLMVTVDPVKDKKGELAGAVHIVRDMTEQKKVKEALRESHKVFTSFMNQLPVTAFMKDENGKVQYVNPYMTEEFGADKWINQTAAEYFPPEIAEGVLAHDKRALSEGPSSREEWVPDRNGQMRCMQTYKFPIHREGKPPLIGGVAIDITERKRAEEEIAKLAKFPGENPNAVLRISGEGTVLYNNKAGLPILSALGYKVGERLSAHWQEFVLAVLRHRQSQEAEIECGDRIYSLIFAPIADADYVNVYGLDITERKRAEEKLIDYQAQLKSLASQLTLAEERERRRIAMELHDRISQTLAICKLELDALRASASCKSFLQVLDEVSDSLGKVIADTRSLTFDLSFPLLYELGFEAAVAAWLTEQIEKKYGIATEFKEDKEHKPLDDNVRVLLFRSVQELLINVVKHSQAKKATVSVCKVGDRIHVSVEDDGVGFNVKEVTGTVGKTGGFGLFSIRERLEELDGHFEIESEPGKGTKVTLIAPLKQSDIKHKQG